MRYFKTNNGIRAIDIDQEDLIELDWKEISEQQMREETGPKPADKIALCKAEAKQRLTNTDWSQLPDVQSTLKNKAEFDAYRAIIRVLAVEPVENPVWPVEPESVWS
jgi:Phage tail assembly chaperone protein